MSMAFGNSLDNLHSGSTSVSSKITKTRIIIGVLGVACISLFISVLVLAQRPRVTKKIEPTVMTRTCRDASCRQFASDFKYYMDTTVNPCDDFYSYTCNNWKKRNPANDSYPQTMPLVLLQMSTYEKLSKLLADFPKSVKPRGIASFLYSSCVTDYKNNRKDDLLRVVNQYNGWPILSNSDAEIKKETLSTVFGHNLQALIRHNLKIMIQFQVLPNMWEREKFTLSIMKGEFISKFSPDPLPANNYATTDEIQTLVCFMNPDCNKLSNLQMDIKEIYDLDQLLKSVMNAYEFSFEKHYASSPENYYITLAELNKEAPLTGFGLDWLQVVRTILKDNTVDQNFKVFTVSRAVNGILRILKSKTIRVVKNWFVLQVIKQLGPKFSGLFRPISIATEIRCAAEVTTLMPYAAAEIYNIHWSQIPERKEMIVTLFTEFRKAIFGLIADGWLDQDARQRLTKKLESVVPYVGFPDWILDETALSKYYKIQFNATSSYVAVIEALLGLEWPREAARLKEKFDRNNYWFRNNLLEANAWYTPLVNSITIPMGILDYPFLPDVTAPRSVIYGMLGHIVAHEIFHGLDPIGIAFDYEGQMNSIPFSAKVTKMYEENMLCLINQYTNLGLNGVQTITEDFPDNAAMRIVFKAYQDRTATNEVFYDDLLPNLDQPLMKQFFISFASTWCADVTKDFLPFVLKDTHSLSRYRVNVPLMNSQEFSEVFQCPKGSFMNPEHKCRVF